MAELKSRANLVVVTSRQHVIAQHTIDWLGRYYPGQVRGGGRDLGCA